MNKIESLNNDELKEVLIKKSKKELANAIIEIRKHDTKLVDDCIEKAKKNLPFYETEPNPVFNVYDWKTCEYFGEFNVFNGTIFDCEKWAVMDIFDVLIKAVDENLYKNRFTADIDLILVNRETLQPEARVQYLIDNGKPDIFIDVVEHDVRCLFFSNLERKILFKAEEAVNE